MLESLGKKKRGRKREGWSGGYKIQQGGGGGGEADKGLKGLDLAFLTLTFSAMISLLAVPGPASIYACPQKKCTHVLVHILEYMAFQLIPHTFP